MTCTRRERLVKDMGNSNGHSAIEVAGEPQWIGTPINCGDRTRHRIGRHGTGHQVIERGREGYRSLLASVPLP